MRFKILTVDDSRTVRLIIRKAFRAFDCEILEAANGVEGLSAAGNEIPDLILLDVTMPVMDGVEMLTRVRSDPKLKQIPIIMLTAEGGREQVMKIAKIGIRDYVVKPFKEEVLVQKVARILDLRPVEQGPDKIRSVNTPLNILVVENMPAIVSQIQAGLRHTPWKVHGVDNQSDAMAFIGQTMPDVVILSLALTGGAAFPLFRLMRANAHLKFRPIIGMAVKTDAALMAQATEVGFTSIITKPIDMAELEARISKALHLDTSTRYFELDSEFLTLRVGPGYNQQMLQEISEYLATKVVEAVNGGVSKAIFDIHEVELMDTHMLKMLAAAMKTCRDLNIGFALIGNETLRREAKGFEDTQSWRFLDSVEDGRTYLAQRYPSAGAAPKEAAAVPAGS